MIKHRFFAFIKYTKNYLRVFKEFQAWENNYSTYLGRQIPCYLSSEKQLKSSTNASKLCYHEKLNPCSPRWLLIFISVLSDIKHKYA